MSSIGDRLEGNGIIRYTSQVAHVTFYITEDDSHVLDRYKLFSYSEDRGLQQTWDEDNSTAGWLDKGFETYEQACEELLKVQIKLEETIEKRRSGFPTPKQLFFLFTHKIPIPIDLTWGQASDLIDEKLQQNKKDKEARRLERFQGFTEGDKVAFYFTEFVPLGEEKYERKKVRKEGQITKLYQAGGSKFVVIEAGNSTFRFREFSGLQKITE